MNRQKVDSSFPVRKERIRKEVVVLKTGCTCAGAPRDNGRERVGERRKRVRAAIDDVRPMSFRLFLRLLPQH